MTDEIPVELVTATASQEPEIPSNPEEIRLKFYETVRDVYAALMGVMNRLPIHPQVKQNAITRFDEGLLWTREGIGMLNFNVPAEPEVSEAPEVAPENPAVASEAA